MRNGKNNETDKNMSFDTVKSKLIKKGNNEFKVHKSTAQTTVMFEDFEYNDLKFKNHFCYIAGSDNFLCDNFGNPTENYQKFYENVAKSGVGLIFTGGVYVGTKKFGLISRLPKNFANISKNKKNLGSYQRLTKVIHTGGNKIFLTIKPIFGRGDKENKFLNIFNYSASFGKNFYDVKMPSIRLSDSKCTEIAEDYGEVAKLSITSGFDGILIDGTSFNILGEFTSTEFNRRKYGYYSDSIDFPKKILNKIKNTSPKVNIFYKFSINSFLTAVYGYRIKYIESLSGIKKHLSEPKIYELLTDLIKLGVDGFVFEFGTYETSFLKDYSQFACENLYGEILTDIKQFFTRANIKNKHGNDVIIVSTDNYNNITSFSNMITENIVDFLDVTKQIYSDNNYLRSLQNKTDFVPCLKCSVCNYNLEKTDSLNCVVNPNIMGKKLLPTTRQIKRVAVVGSGISGLNCAIWLAERGFEVEIFEKSSKLNRNGRLCEVFKYDELLSEYNNYIENRVQKLASEGKIKLSLGKEFMCDKVQNKTYFAIIVATGFHERFLEIPGAVLNTVKSIYDVLNLKNMLENKKDIVILVKSELSLKLAVYLLNIGKTVNLIMPSLDFIFNISKGKLTYYLKALKELHANVFVLSKIKKIEEDFVEVIFNNKFKNQSFDATVLNYYSGVRQSYDYRTKSLDCDLLIYEPEIYSNNRLYYELVKSGYSGELYMIGNALEISGMENDIKSAYFVAKNL